MFADLLGMQIWKIGGARATASQGAQIVLSLMLMIDAQKKKEITIWMHAESSGPDEKVGLEPIPKLNAKDLDDPLSTDPKADPPEG